MTSDNQIIQIIPGAGWTATYKFESGEERTFPLVAWGLTAGGDVLPLDADAHGLVDVATNIGNFIRIEANHD